jgi:NTP pyrophosphatase (non-canonical NTP hydrolase)
MLNKLSKEIHENAVNHGWWEREREFGSLVALMHSELSEALEEHRNGKLSNEIYYSGEHGRYTHHIPLPEKGIDKPEGIPIELADCIIRILDYCGKQGIDIDEAIRIKHEYNKTRPYRHGGKKI